jgi:hypothetical protein
MSAFTKNVLRAYPALASLLVIYLLFFVRMDFLLQVISVVLVCLGFLVLLVADRIMK